MKRTTLLLGGCIALFSLHSALAETTIINNNYPPNSNGNTQQSNNCQSQNNDPGTPPGTYYQTNPHGGMDTVYSTGEKKPYIIDNNCNNNPAIVQPYVYAPGVLPPQGNK